MTRFSNGGPIQQGLMWAHNLSSFCRYRVTSLTRKHLPLVGRGGRPARRAAASTLSLSLCLPRTHCPSLCLANTHCPALCLAHTVPLSRSLTHPVAPPLSHTHTRPPPGRSRRPTRTSSSYVATHSEQSALYCWILEILYCNPKGRRALLRVPSAAGRSVCLCWAKS
jgi:hypothetical protein